MQWIRAVGRIELGDGSHGTGFLIAADGLVLTAFHVVAHRDQSLVKLAPVWRPGPIKIVLGDPNNPPTLWDAGEATVYLDRYSIDDDWAMLEIARPPAEIVPLALADYELPRVDHAFTTFGFPTVKAQIGGVYHGTVAKWPVAVKPGDAGPAVAAGANGTPLAELDAINLEADAKGGEDAGGISGAPCVVDNRAVAIVLRSLANARGQAVARSLYAVPLLRAAHSLRGLVPWDDGKPVAFQRVVERKLPSDPLKLEAAAGVLGMPGVRERSPMARRLLATRLATASDALIECDIGKTDAGMIIERVAAMRLNEDAVAKVRTPLVRDGKVPPLAILSGTRARIRKWYVQRAYADRKLPDSGNTIVTVVFKSTAAERPSDGAVETIETIVDDIVERARRVLDERRVAGIDDLLSPTPQGLASGMWLVLVNETRPEVLTGVRDRLPNAQVILVLDKVMQFPAPYQDLAAPVYPVMSSDEQKRLISAWNDALRPLDVPTEPEVDT